jgi:hypothetical protein
LVDFSKPVAVTLLAILHAVPDFDDPYAIVAKVTDALPPGSTSPSSTLLGSAVWRAARKSIAVKP